MLNKMMSIPEECEKIINLQRSGYKDIINDFISDMISEFYQMLDFLPYECHSIMDIGCGLGAIDVLLSKFFDDCDLHLIDKDKIDDKIKYGFKLNESSFYTSFDLIRKIMAKNEIINYSLYDLNNKLPEFKNIDVIISLLSCGFHYDVNNYIEFIYKSISDNGVLILDIRKDNKEQIDTIKKYFSDIKEIKTNNMKTIRICVKGKL